ncbi:polymer-forming cytoskeletal protein [Niallia oryzisoli]|uniref:polymer-forming cytoskeletal protein n=1 Tax=Niallia oryzisoli TaxID=1737571 RepID=UPI00373672A7
MKWKALLTSIFLVGLLTACGGGDDDKAADDNATTENEDKAAEETEDNAATEETEKEDADKEQTTDALTTASIVNEPDAFKKAVSKEGTWIVAILEDLTVDDEVVVAGEFHDKNDATKDIYRKLALYSQDENHNITASYTLTVPKLTVQSPNFKIQGGTVKGDVVVEAQGFTLDKTATIDGNLIYANEDLKNSAVIDGKVTGSTETNQ